MILAIILFIFANIANDNVVRDMRLCNTFDSDCETDWTISSYHRNLKYLLNKKIAIDTSLKYSDMFKLLSESDSIVSETIMYNSKDSSCYLTGIYLVSYHKSECQGIMFALNNPIDITEEKKKNYLTYDIFKSYLYDLSMSNFKICFSTMAFLLKEGNPVPILDTENQNVSTKQGILQLDGFGFEAREDIDLPKSIINLKHLTAKMVKESATTYDDYYKCINDSVEIITENIVYESKNSYVKITGIYLVVVSDGYGYGIMLIMNAPVKILPNNSNKDLLFREIKYYLKFKKMVDFRFKFSTMGTLAIPGDPVPIPDSE